METTAHHHLGFRDQEPGTCYGPPNSFPQHEPKSSASQPRTPCALDLREMEAGAILKGEPYRSHAVVVDQFKQRLPICHQCSKGRAALTNLLETGFCILDLRTRVVRGQRVGTIGLNPHLQE